MDFRTSGRATRRLAAAIFACVALASCSQPPIARDALVGRWREAKTGAVLILSDNGNAALINWPLSKIQTGTADQQRVNAHGGWMYMTIQSGHWPETTWMFDIHVEIDGHRGGHQWPAEYGWCLSSKCIQFTEGDPDDADGEFTFFKE